MFNEYPDVLNVNELCSALNIGRNTAYKLLNETKIKSIRIGKTYKIPKTWLIEYINNVA